MPTTTDEINLQRLLISCENRLKSDSVETWTASDKRKFATYVKYLGTLQKKTSSPTTTIFSNRIDQLTRAVAVNNMHMDVEKGISEAQLVKKRHMDELKKLEKSDPDWLLELKQQDEKAAMEQTLWKKKLLEEEDPEIEEEIEEEEEEEEEEEDYIENEKETPATTTASEIRQRNNTNKRESETSNIEHVLQHHRQMHDELTTDLGKMAKQLKINSQAFGDILSKDDVVLKEAQQAVESNLERMTQERQRLDIHHSKSWGTSFMTMGVVIFVSIMFVLVFFTIKFLPKAS